MTEIPKSHPRYASLVIRERLVEGFRRGLVAPQGLLAHGRGEAFDYLLGEETLAFARQAIRVGAAHLLLARLPAISVNGNTAALVPTEIATLADATGARIEVNLFHRTEERVRAIREWLESHGCKNVLGENPDAKIPGLDSARAHAHAEGIAGADVVLVPLEDGDRAEAFARVGKTVVAIDLNPLSRTAAAASVTIVDNVVRAMPRLVEEARELRDDRTSLEAIVAAYDNPTVLRESIAFTQARLHGFKNP